MRGIYLPVLPVSVPPSPVPAPLAALPVPALPVSVPPLPVPAPVRASTESEVVELLVLAPVGLDWGLGPIQPTQRITAISANIFPTLYFSMIKLLTFNTPNDLGYAEKTTSYVRYSA
jgi:hypothetical protein